MAHKLGPVFGNDEDRRRRMLMAQSLWDATMAWTILCELGKGDTSLSGSVGRGEERACFHVCGRFHCEHFIGIPEHLEYYLTQGSSSSCDLERVSELIREELRVIVCISKSSLEEVNSERTAFLWQAERSAYLADAADFVILCP
mmetsp:Transcript_62816/g.86350  ORF Transcript_62816/g.86350 Transcript_62816/m.86350 type:complete len:144 (-) Transcript_62816:195-626(-)